MTSLRILVPIKRVIDYALKPRIASGKVDLSGLKMSMNPFDEIAVEESLLLRKEHKDKVSDILAVSIGPQKAQEILRTALAMGVDRGLLVEENGEVEPLAVAKVLKEIVQKEDRNMVILGKQAIDDDSSQTGQMLAGLLGWPQATCASNVEVNPESGEVTVTREVDGGEETVKAKLPIVITTDLRLNVPRYASLQSIMKARKKALDKKTLKDYDVDTKSRLETIEVSGRFTLVVRERSGMG